LPSTRGGRSRGLTCAGRPRRPHSAIRC
jgi:hypothetical protein